MTSTKEIHFDFLGVKMAESERFSWFATNFNRTSNVKCLMSKEELRQFTLCNADDYPVRSATVAVGAELVSAKCVHCVVAVIVSPVEQRWHHVMWCNECVCVRRSSAFVCHTLLTILQSRESFCPNDGWCILSTCLFTCSLSQHTNDSESAIGLAVFGFLFLY